MSVDAVRDAGGVSAARAFCDDVEAAYRRAAARGVESSCYRIGAQALRLHFADAAMAAVMTPALAHLRIADAGEADLTVDLWDVAASGVELPRCPWDWHDNPARGDILGLGGDGFHVAYNQFARLLSVFDRERGRALCVTANVAECASYLGATPLVDILHWWLARHGLQTVHGGAVGVAAGGVLLAGKGGSGKSTTALACLRSRLGFAGDDYCAVSVRGTPEVHSLYSSARVELDNLPRFPHLVPLAIRHAAPAGSGEKATIFLHPSYAEQLVPRFPLRAVVLPRVAGGARSTLEPTSAMRALRELSITTISQRAGAGRQAFAGIAAVVRALPCYALSLGTDLDQLVGLLEDLVDVRP